MRPTLIRSRSQGRCRAALAAAAVVAVAGATLPVPGTTAAYAESAGTSTRVIVELAAPPALAALDGDRAGPESLGWLHAGARSRELHRDQQALMRRAADDGVDLTVTKHLTAAYNGFVADVPAGQLASLRDLPQVRAVHRDETFSLMLSDSVPLVGAPEVWDRPGDDGSTGAGVTVAVIDSGVDYRHPDLGGGFGPGHTVVAGHDFVNDDADPMDDMGHGTHVAGIVAADGKVQGVAPDATLTAYKVVNQFGTGSTSDIIAGLDAAVHPDNPHRADVVNMSLGGPGDGTDPLSTAAAEAVAAGVVVVTSAGNQGPFNQSVTAPATADGVLAVGASASGVQVPRAAAVHPVQEDLRAVRHGFSADPPPKTVELEVVDIGRGLPGSYDDVDVAGRAVLLEEPGGLEQAFAYARHAEDRGAAAALFYFPDFWGSTTSGGAGAAGRSSASALAPGLRGSEPRPEELHDAFRPGIEGIDDGRLAHTPAMRIPGASATVLQKHLADGEVRIEIDSIDATDWIVDFSSRGPTSRFTQKPELVAPGVEILSTMPNGEYGRANGTSMAAPHVAGAAALMRDLQPDWEASQVMAALANSAHRVDDFGPLAQGAGRLDVPAATGTTVLADPPAVSLGVADRSGSRLVETGSLTLRNGGAQPADLTLEVVEHGGADGATVSLDTDAATLGPGEAVEVALQVEAPASVAETDVTGWVTVDVDNNGSGDLSVPYLLAVRSLQLHVTPDPATVDTGAEVFVRSPASLVGPPTVTVECPGLDPQQPALAQVNESLWRGSVDVEEAGACRVEASGVTDNGRGERHLAGAARSQVSDPPSRDRGVAHWQPIGPNAEAGWLAFSDDRHRMSVVPTRWPSVFVTDDRMQTWREHRTMPVAGGTPASVAVHPDDDDTMYVGVNGGGGVDPTYAGRVLVTTDGGLSWDIVPRRDSHVNHVLLDATGETLAVVDAEGVRVTHDGGDHWTDLPGDWSGVRDAHWIGADLYLASNQGLVRFPGAADTSGSAGDPEILFEPGALGWAGRVAGDADTLLVSRYPFPQLYRSSDGGETFTMVLDRTGISIQSLEMEGDSVYAMQPTGSRGGGLWVSEDRGDNWELWGDPVEAAVELETGAWPNPHPTVRGTRYVSSSGAGIYATDEPGEFERTGIPAADVLSLDIADGGDGEALVAGTVRDTFRTTLTRRAAIRPDDLEWQSSGGEGFRGVEAVFLATSPADPSVVYKIQYDPQLTFGIYRSDDGGVTWDRVASPGGTPTSLLVHPADPDQIMVGYHTTIGAGMVQSTDGGATWRKRDHGRAFEALAGDPTDPDRIWAGSPDGLYRSTDGGEEFEKVADMRVTALAVDPADPDRLAIGGRGLYTSEDGGTTVERATHIDVSLWVSDFVVAPDGQMYASSIPFFDEIGVVQGGRGVFASDDGGASWTQMNRGLGNPNVTSLAVDGHGRFLYAGTLGGSVHRIMLRGGPPGGGPGGPPSAPPGGPAMPR